MCGFLSIDFACAPERHRELIDSTLAEVDRSRTETTSEEKVHSMVQMFKREHEEQLRTNGEGLYCIACVIICLDIVRCLMCQGYWLSALSSCVTSSRLEHHDGNITTACKEVQEVVADRRGRPGPPEKKGPASIAPGAQTCQ